MALDLTKLSNNLLEFQKKYQDLADEEVLEAVDTLINFLDELDGAEDETGLADLIEEDYD